MRRNLNEFLICNSSYIYNCAQDYREAAAFAFAKKPVLHEECAMLKFRICLFLLTSLTECAQRTLERPLSSLAVLRCGQSATQEKKIYRCACVHTDFTDCIHFIQKQQNCSQKLFNLLDSLKQTLVNIWICVKEQNETMHKHIINKTN